MEPSKQSFHSSHFKTILKTNIELLLSCEEKDCTLIMKQAMDWFRGVEKRFSHLLADSELSLLNTLAGENCMVSTTMLEVLFLAETYQSLTNGNYRPLLQNGTPTTPEKASATLAWEVDPAMKSVKLPNHTTIDLRGIEQSWSIKRLADYLRKNMSLEQGLILAGGDMTVWGRSSLKLDPWVIGIQNPWNANAKLGAIAMHEGSLSTYSQFEDNAAGSGSDIVQCTVAGQDMVECQVWARILCTVGIEDGLALLAKHTSICEAVVLSTKQQLHYFGSEASLHRRWLDMRIDHYHFQDIVS